MCRYLCANIICSKMRIVLRERICRKTKSFQEQIMSKDKYQFIFSNKIEAIVFIILQRFCNAREKCLRTAYRMQRGLFFLSDFRYDLCKKKFHFSVKITKPYTILNKNLKLILITIEIMFKDWELSLG